MLKYEYEGKKNMYTSMFCFVKPVIGVCDFDRAHWEQCQLLPELAEGSIPSATTGNRTLCGGAA